MTALVRAPTKSVGPAVARLSDRLYKPDGYPFDPLYGRLYELLFVGGNYEAAKLHHAMLEQHCREGYRFFGYCTQVQFEAACVDANDFYAVDVDFDPAGENKQGQVAVFERVSSK